MSKQNIKDKNGKVIGEYNPKALRYRYNVDGNNKSSVTTKINKRSSADFSNWYKRNRIDSIKEIMLFDKEPLDKVNDNQLYLSLNL